MTIVPCTKLGKGLPLFLRGRANYQGPCETYDTKVGLTFLNLPKTETFISDHFTVKIFKD